MEVEVVRCMDCINCKIMVPRSLELVRCSANVFKHLGIDHPYLIVYRTCEFADTDDIRVERLG